MNQIILKHKIEIIKIPRIKEEFKTALDETFFDIPGFPGYTVNKKGEVKGKKGWILKPAITKDGYHQLIICDDDGQQKHLMVNRIMGKLFLENPDNLTELDHIDGNRSNNHISNLRWVTPRQNLCLQERVKNAKCYRLLPNGSFQVRYQIEEGQKFDKTFKTEEEAIECVKYLKKNFPHLHFERIF